MIFNESRTKQVAWYQQKNEIIFACELFILAEQTIKLRLSEPTNDCFYVSSVLVYGAREFQRSPLSTPWHAYDKLTLFKNNK